jgi:hypothetical protein
MKVTEITPDPRWHPAHPQTHLTRPPCPHLGLLVPFSDNKKMVKIEGRKLSQRSQIELNRPMKGVSFRRVNHAELKLPPWAKVRGLGGRIFWPKAGILVRCRSLGVKGFITSVFFGNPGAARQNAGVSPRFATVDSGLRALCVPF